ncbi:MAG: MBL fold metallo-hydrolase [Cellvibrionaceae bacterium]|nr:MBL fold metallo-hydrolase [Cellvibrionaceae bacterium]
MNCKSISLVGLACALVLSGCSNSKKPQAPTISNANELKSVAYQHVRNATARVTYGTTTFLVDPMLADKGAYPGFEGTYRSEIRNPRLDLPTSAQDVIEDIDAVIITHTHLDHWDKVAQELLPKGTPIFVQDDSDAKLIKSQGFLNVRTLSETINFQGVTLHKVKGQHASDTVFSIPQAAKALGNVMGVVLKSPGYKTTYIAGDTVWTPDVSKAIDLHTPEIIVLNTGAAELSSFPNDPILMGKSDALRATQVAPRADVIAVHMDTLNHCKLSRSELRHFVVQQKIETRVRIPNDGSTITL